MKTKKTNNLIYFYWIIPIIAAIPQFIFTQASEGQIRSEELIESVRSIWWFQNGLVTDGGYANLGWYALQLFFYNLFGYSVHAAKYIKFFVQLISFFALAGILSKYLNPKIAWLPLFAITLSPTFLFLNTLQISHGIEVNYFLICIFLIDFLNFKSPKVYLPQMTLCWALAMFAWMTYPSFIYYLPILGSFFLYKLWKNKKLNHKIVLVCLLAFLLPLILGILYIQNRHLLLYDRDPQRGLFRSNGGFDVNSTIFFDNLNILKNDLFVAYDSYYYENPKVEFSDIYPIAAIILTFILSAYIFKNDKKFRLLIGVILGFIVGYLILLNMIGPLGLGGVRRATSILLLFYGLSTVVLYYFTVVRKNENFKKLAIGIFAVLICHHLLVYPENLSHLKIPTPYREPFWFAQSESPQKSLDMYLSQVQKADLQLICYDQNNKPINCRGYSLIESAVKGSCEWNRLRCHEISGFDTALGKFVPLDFNYYSGNNWER